VNHPKIIHTLLIFQTKEWLAEARKLCLQTFPSHFKLQITDNLVSAAELIEIQNMNFDLVIIEHLSKAQAMLKSFIALQSKAYFIVATPKEHAKILKLSISHLALIDTNAFAANLQVALVSIAQKDQFQVSGEHNTNTNTNSKQENADDFEFVSLPTENFIKTGAVIIDVYIRMPQGNYVRLYKIGDDLDNNDIRQLKKRGESFYQKIQKSTQVTSAIRPETTLKNLDQALDKDKLPFDQAAALFNQSIDQVRDLLQNGGFDQNAQMIAKKSIELAVRALGSKPRLATILKQLKDKSGDYIITHSFLVGQVACALAYQMQWPSSSTYLKLSLAAFLHDISLNSTDLALIDYLPDAESSGRFSHQDILALKMHPVKASELSRNFTEIPSDVDQILNQHHERPDGKGFPKQISGKAISPLAALFIIAHDMVHAMYKDETLTYQKFLHDRQDYYSVGQFKKIILKILGETSAA
jgi:HD-GYP domain-containing protein (c-di-GMP phosphodiesterase class II)